MRHENVIPFEKEIDASTIIGRLLQQHSLILEEIKLIKKNNKVWLSLSLDMKNLINESEKLSTQIVSDMHKIIDGSALKTNILDEPTTTETDIDIEVISQKIDGHVKTFLATGDSHEKAIIKKVTAYN